MVQETIERAIRGLEEELEKWWKKLRHHFPHHPRLRREVYQVFTIFIDNQTFIIMNLNLKPGKRYTISVALIDKVLQAPVPGAQLVANKSNTIDNPAVAVIDADGKAAYVAPGKANLTTVNTWSYQDEATGEQTQADVTTTVQITCLVAAEVVDQTVDLTNEEDIPAPAQPAAGATA